MTTEINIAPQRPAPRDPTRLYSPAENRAWDAAESAYWQSVRAAERDADRKKEADKAFANRVLDDSEYHAFSVARLNENRARELERQVAAHAAEERKREALAASPDVAEILTTNPVDFLTDFAHWTKKNYEVDLSGPVMFGWQMCHVHMKPAAKKAKGAAA